MLVCHEYCKKGNTEKHDICDYHRYIFPFINVANSMCRYYLVLVHGIYLPGRAMMSGLFMFFMELVPWLGVLKDE
uniref:Uncharacterized protein n=1 Tax=Arundo donax TaxID=35708 RepID=A0A0A9DX17_ARUDO